MPLPVPAAAAPPPAAAPPTPVRAADATNTVVVPATERVVIAPSSKVEAPARTIITKTEAPQPEVPKTAPAKTEIAKLEIAKPEPHPAQAHAHGGWIIQIGAFEGEEEAKQHLSEARLKMPSILASADPFTERVQKGDKALYRARFAGFDKAMAEAACKQLKRSEIACLTVKN
jgi:D-alanyl-D-alanine carboxypeptidase